MRSTTQELRADAARGGWLACAAKTWQTVYTVRLAPTLLRAWLATAPPELRLEEEVFDTGAVTSGLLARVESADDWVITGRVLEGSDETANPSFTVEPCPSPEGPNAPSEPRVEGEPVRCEASARSELVIDVSLRRPDGTLLLRRLTLDATDVAGRSRELASLLAVLIEGGLVGEEIAPPSEPAQPAPSPGLAPEPAPTIPTPAASNRDPMATQSYGPIRWVVAEGRLGYGDAQLRGGAVLDGGLGVSAGGRLLRDHLLLRGAAAWSRSSRPTLVLDGYRVGVGIGGGASLWHRRLWLGGDVTPQLLVVTVADVSQRALTSSSVELAGHAQLGIRRFTFQVRAGADLVFPPIVGIGRDDAISWGAIRFFGAVGLGARF